MSDSKKLNDELEERAELPEDQWIELPPGKSIIDHHNEQKENSDEANKSIQQRINDHKKSLNAKLSTEDKLKIISEDKELIEHLQEKQRHNRGDGNE